MPTNTFPATALQDLDATRGTALQPLNNPSHVTHHTLEDDVLEALQAKVGIDSSAVTTSLDYILKNTTGGHDHDGTDSKKVIVTNLDVAGLTALGLLRTNTGGTALESAGIAVSDVVTATSTTTLTNKTLTSPLMTSPSVTSGDVNLATGLNIQVNSADPKRGIYVPSSAMFPSTTAPCASLTQVESSTNDVNIKVLDFDGAGTSKEYAEFGLPSPLYWDALTITAQFVWYATAGSGTVNWEIQGLALSDDDALDTAFGTLQEVTDTLLATGDVHISPITSAVTIAGTPVAGDWVNFKIARDPANDTNTSDARLMGVIIRFGIKQYDDA